MKINLVSDDCTIQKLNGIYQDKILRCTNFVSVMHTIHTAEYWLLYKMFLTKQVSVCVQKV